MKTSLLRFILLIAVAAMAASAAFAVPAPSGAKLTFRRIFKGSSPEFIEISVREDSDIASAAAQLLQIFEGLARQQEHVDLISRRMKYDRLGINDALLQFESDLNRSLLPEPQRVLPVLDQIASDSRFVDIARQRARSLAERIRHQG